MLSKHSGLFKLAFAKANRIKHGDVRVDTTLKELRIFCTRLHFKSELGYLCCSLINLETKEVLREDHGRNIFRKIAFLLVDRIQKIESVNEDMSRSTRGVEHCYLLRRVDLQETRRRLTFNVIIHGLFQGRTGIVQHPKSP